jgi:hypothetical protein
MATSERSAKGGCFPALFAIRVRIYRPPFSSNCNATKPFDEPNSAHDDARKTFASRARRRARTINNDSTLKRFRVCGARGTRTDSSTIAKVPASNRDPEDCRASWSFGEEAARCLRGEKS